MTLHFTREEFAARKAAALRAMEEAGLDGLVMFRPDSLYWLTGYDSDGYVMFQCGYLGADDNEAIRFVQDGLRRSVTDRGIVMLDPKNEGGTDTLISEASIRSLYRHYREVMSL